MSAPEDGKTGRHVTDERIAEIRASLSEITFHNHSPYHEAVSDLLAHIDRLNALDDHLQSQMGSELGKVAWAESVIADLRQRVAGLEGELAAQIEVDKKVIQKLNNWIDSFRINNAKLAECFEKSQADLSTAKSQLEAARVALREISELPLGTEVGWRFIALNALPPVEGKDRT